MSDIPENLTPAAEHSELPVRSLRWYADTGLFDFPSTAFVEPLDGIIGQRRALEALTLGAEIFSPGYNIFVSGLAGTGRMTTIKNILEGLSPDCHVPHDYAFVNNFANADSPRLLKFPRGKALRFQAAVLEAISYMRNQIPKTFDDENYRSGRVKIIEDFQNRERQMIAEFEERLKPEGFALGQKKTGSDMVQPELMPLVDDKSYSMSSLDEMVREGTISLDQMKKFGEDYKRLQGDLYILAKQGMKLSQEFQRELTEYERNAARTIIDTSFEEVRAKHPYPEVQIFLEEAREYLLNNLDIFKRQHQNDSGDGGSPATESDPFALFTVNVVLDNSKTEGCPIVIETTPTYINIFGTVEKVQDQRGYWTTDFTRIKGGSLLRADGGYLIINAPDALSEPGVWKAFKRVLLHRKLEIQSIESFFQSGQQVSAMKPQAIDLNVKVILVGDSRLYQALFQMEEDFRKIFKINAEFDYEIERSDSILMEYARFIRKVCDEESLLHFDRDGIAAIIEYAVEKAGHSEKISLRFSDIADLLREASFWAEKDTNEVVTRYHVEKAHAKMIDRNSMWKEKMMERILEGTLMIDTRGRKIGQINGLAVYSVGQISFGKPTRITATVAVGGGGIVNIEREARLSGSIYNKGTMILLGFLRHRFAQRAPLSFAASIVFEQSYGGVDGDSASSTEVYALLSALSRVPIRQDLAVTGSVNQWGEVQPIGGVKEKIEGFYDVCREHGITGTQGALIPYQNVKDLMLRGDLVEAVAEGKFHIYPVMTIDQGIELMTGVAAGVRSEDGTYPPGTINYLVEQRLHELSEALRRSMPMLLNGSATTMQEFPGAAGGGDEGEMGGRGD
jgi:ATP-dependent Lon protease